jgi:predicted SAM-dependent methyltransferase
MQKTQKETGFLMQVNLGCGTRYLDGWVNVDGNKSVKSDILCDMSEGLPFDNDSVDRVLLSHVIEHIPHHKVWEFFDELYRVCKDGAVVEIFVPHFTSIHAFGITHYSAWHINSMNVFEDKCRANYSDEREVQAPPLCSRFLV